MALIKGREDIGELNTWWARLVYILSAIAVTWLGPAEEASNAKVLVVEADGGFQYGNLVAGKANTVNVLSKPGAKPIEIQVGDVLAVHSVSTCP